MGFPAGFQDYMTATKTVQAKNKITEIRKRDGHIVPFDQEKITNAIFKAAQSVGGTDREPALRLSDKVVAELEKKFHSRSIPAVEEIQDIVEKVLIEEGHAKTAKAFILYRAKRAEIRKAALEAAGSRDVDKSALLEMFAHKSKLSSLISYDIIESYKELLFGIKEDQRSGALHVHKDYLGGNELAINIYEKKYYLKDLKNRRIEKKPEDVFARLAAFMAAIESAKEMQAFWANKFYNALYEGLFLPGGRVIAGAGDMYRLKTLANCFVSMIQGDDLESIYKTAYECARTYSYGGGIGVDISGLRPRGSVVHNAADCSTGAVSFMELYSLTTGLIGQSGRRGALMLTLDIKHPDAEHFINIKKSPNWITAQIVDQCRASGRFSGQQIAEIERRVRENIQVRFANISLKVTDEFMQAVKEQNEHGPEKILVYRKNKAVSNVGVPQGGLVHYSYSIPSKPIDKYELLKTFSSLEKLNKFLSEIGAHQITEYAFSDLHSRDMFGDIVIELTDADYDLAVRKAGDFMLYFNTSQTGEIKKLVKAREIWDPFVEGNYRTAEPGLIFWSTMTRYSPSNYVGRPIISTNPCGEIPLEHGGACNLGALNLSRMVKDGYSGEATIDWEKLKETTALLTRFLDNVVTWNEKLNPLASQRTAASETRRLGLGVMGIADMLNQLGIKYDSKQGIGIMENVMKTIANVAYMTSAELAREKGVSPIFDYAAYSECPFFREALDEETREAVRKNGLRNIALLTIAPTGTISNIVLGYQLGGRNYIGVSSGIEPVFALYYTRRSESFAKFFKVFHSTVEAYIQKNNLTDKAQQTNEEELKRMLPEHFFRTAHFIDPEKRVLIQGMCQKYIDHSISSTVNLPEDIEPEVISNIYLDAWKNMLKGITIYRDGSRYPILSVESGATEFQNIKEKDYRVEIDGAEKAMKGGDVFLLNSRLTTVYHAMKNGAFVEEKGVLRIPSGSARQTKEDASMIECPSCGKKTLKLENGCRTCTDSECGYGACEA